MDSRKGRMWGGGDGEGQLQEKKLNEVCGGGFLMLCLVLKE